MPLGVKILLDVSYRLYDILLRRSLEELIGEVDAGEDALCQPLTMLGLFKKRMDRIVTKENIIGDLRGFIIFVLQMRIMFPPFIKTNFYRAIGVAHLQVIGNRIGGKGVNTRFHPPDNQLIKYCRIRHYFASRFPTSSWNSSGSPVSQFMT